MDACVALVFADDCLYQYECSDSFVLSEVDTHRKNFLQKFFPIFKPVSEGAFFAATLFVR